jgi:hypothetical protein
MAQEDLDKARSLWLSISLWNESTATSYSRQKREATLMAKSFLEKFVASPTNTRRYQQERAILRLLANRLALEEQPNAGRPSGTT